LKALLVLAALAALLSGCTRYVKGDNLDLSIKNDPCKVIVKVDGNLILEATATTPCKRD
jgi:ABC-type uncharacterized transport system auxiliary subunit|tara:strand:- start:446 stop:622 length:177 start_codon:yes stop_codon:yes gene_type:complete